MMTTTYPNHAMQPQMAHPHPMAPGPNPGQPGMGHMQMHPGVSNQGGPVSQAGPMMGMQPGMGPNNHALQHLQPQQAAQLFQQQQAQQQMHMNPQLLHQRNHQNFLRQQQQQQMLQQQQQNGMGMGFPSNMTSNMTPQHMAAMQGGMGGPAFASMPNLPPHLQALQQQQQAVHQNRLHQHQQQQQQQATGNPHAQAMAQAQAAHQAQQQAAQAAHAQSQAAQHAQAMQQQHSIAMQHAASQSSNHSQSGNQGQGPPATTQPQQAPLRPPSAIGSHQGQHSPAPPPTPQQPQQQGPPPPQQTPTQNPTPNGPQQPNPQAQHPQTQQRSQAMAQAQAQAQAQQAQAQAQQQGPNQTHIQAARLAMMKQQAVQQQQQQQQSAQGQGTLKLLNFIDHLGKMNTAPEPHPVDKWKQFVDKFFSETGSFIHAFWLENTDRTKQFEIVYSAIPRYFYTLFNTDVESLQITIDGAIEKVVGSDIRVTCDRAKFIYTYKTPCPMQVVCRGKLTAYWAGSDKLEWLQFETENHQTFIQRAALEQLFTQPSPNQMLTQSPRMNKSSAKQRQNQQRLAQENLQPMLKKSELPAPDVTDMGIPPALQSYLEIYETMNAMTNLMVHYQDNNNMTPAQAMNSWVNQMSGTLGQQQNAGNAMQGGNMPQNMQLLQQSMQPQSNMPPGARTPQGVGPGGQPSHQFMSPAMQNSLLPNAALNGSPHLMQQGHTPSPSSVPMGVSLSQQGSSATASVNTSPNVSNKRRRSTAKIDNDEGGGLAVNGPSKTKPSPRIPKRAKGN